MRAAVLISLVLFFNGFAFGQLNNGGFEERQKSQLGVSHWSSFDKPATSSLDSTVARSGKCAMRITGSTKMQSFSQQVSYSATNYEQLLLKAYIKTNELKGNAGLLAVVTGPDGKQGYLYASENDGIKVDSDWTLFSIPIIVAPGTSKMFLGGVMYGTGTSWFDDMSLTSQPSSGTTKPNKKITAYVQEYMKVIRENALAAQTVDLKQLESIVTDFTRTAVKPADCYAAFEFGTKFLKDGHSRFLTPSAVIKQNEESKIGEVNYPTGKLVDGVGYLKVTAIAGGHGQRTIRYADSLQAIVRSLDLQHPAGWIIDLRENTGGNCWPMLAGLGPLIENELCGFFFHKGVYSEPINYSFGAAKMGNDTICAVTHPYTRTAPALRIAVLIGKRTLSSGELVAVSFAQRPGTVLIGTPTGGLTTSNSIFTLSDGAVVSVAASVYADRTKKQYPAGIKPDVTVGPEEDAIKRAVEWIKSGN